MALTEISRLPGFNSISSRVEKLTPKTTMQIEVINPEQSTSTVEATSTPTEIQDTNSFQASQPKDS